MKKTLIYLLVIFVAAATIIACEEPKEDTVTKTPLELAADVAATLGYSDGVIITDTSNITVSKVVNLPSKIPELANPAPTTDPALTQYNLLKATRDSLGADVDLYNFYWTAKETADKGTKISPIQTAGTTGTAASAQTGWHKEIAFGTQPAKADGDSVVELTLVAWKGTKLTAPSAAPAGTVTDKVTKVLTLTLKAAAQ